MYLLYYLLLRLASANYYTFILTKLVPMNHCVAVSVSKAQSEMYTVYDIDVSASLQQSECESQSVCLT